MPGRRAFCRLLLITLCALPLFAAPRPAAATTAILDPALAARLVNAPPATPLSIIVTYSAAPTGADFGRLDALGAQYAPLSQLPMAGVLATPAQIGALRQWPNVASVYLNAPLQFFLHESVPLIGATRVWQDYGYTGDGVGVAVIDTGIDATHADLLLHQATVQNVKVLGLQAAAGQNFDSLHLPQIFLNDIPNTDWTGGHGTHVAGIIGATGGASGGYYKGVAAGRRPHRPGRGRRHRHLHGAGRLRLDHCPQAAVQHSRRQLQLGQHRPRLRPERPGERGDEAGPRRGHRRGVRRGQLGGDHELAEHLQCGPVGHRRGGGREGRADGRLRSSAASPATRSTIPC